ncbi:helix-turn-helix domain-containing protein [Sporolactobacillus pectinivorans]|uniref:helix-turn-helix domain-containing protein n=1 Tax=Sporolactobacillus pectinivorans TaxID=1591408 RepID=UPI000C2679DC|nr:helix-turn-helix domain-containing protein [Sporolactobacillus pectinivorans]
MKNNKRLIPFPIIQVACEGDTIAVHYILKHYEGYMAKLSTTVLTDEYSSGYYFLDRDLQDYLNSALLQMILDFKI